jgi:hypothetical protein
MEPHTDAPTSLAQRPTRGFLALVGIVVLYVLSIGPVSIFYYQMGYAIPNLPADYDPFEGFYHPLRWTAYAMGLDGPIRSYCDWWVALGYHFHKGDDSQLGDVVE